MPKTLQKCLLNGKNSSIKQNQICWLPELLSCIILHKMWFAQCCHFRCLVENSPEFARELFCKYVRGIGLCEKCVFETTELQKFPTPLFNVTFLLLAMTKYSHDENERQNLRASFEKLKEKYSVCLARDETFEQVLILFVDYCLCLCYEQ